MAEKDPATSTEEDLKSELHRVSTHFSRLETRHEPLVINIEDLPDPSQFEKVVNDFLENLRESNPYTYVDHIGEGGMGVVEMVKDKKCLRSIARKTLPKSNMEKEAIIRFTEEAQITAQLEHPNIVPVYDLGIDEAGCLYYTMKMVKGQNLKQVLNKLKDKDPETLKKFPLSHLLEIFLSVCDAMSYACSRKIVHRDLKPDNIMVGDYGEVYLVDWGLAKIIKKSAGQSTEEIPSWIVKEVYEKKNLSNSDILAEIKKIDSLRTKDKDLNISMNDVLIGTPQYMSPERISGEANECSEVYALGAILYNILTLELTVSGDNLEEMVNKIFNEDIKSPLDFDNLPHLPNGKVPPGLAAVTIKALSCTVEDRYQKVSQLRHEITTWEDGLPTEAEKAGPWLMLWSQIKRHKLEASLSVAFVILMISIYAIYFVKLSEDKRNAEDSEKVAMTQKIIADQETENLSKKTEEVKDKINQLTGLAPKLYERSQYLLNINSLKNALNAISNATKLDQNNAKYLMLKGDIEQALEMFEESIKSYERALSVNPDSNRLKDSLNMSRRYRNKDKLEYLDYVQLNEFMITQKRHNEAAYVLRKLYNSSRNLKRAILNKLSKSNLSFVRYKNLILLESGGFSLNLANRNIKDISVLKGLPFKKLDLANNPISDLSALKDMPLERVDISNTNVKDLSPLKGTPLKEFFANNTPIKSLRLLGSCPLENVTATRSNITSLEGLRSPYLRYLNVSFTEIDSLKGLNSRILRSLNLESTNITDLAFLKATQLKHLNLKNSKVVDLKPLENTYITDLNISGTKVTDFSPLVKMPLTVFYGNDLDVSSIEFLKDKHLVLLSMSKTKIKDLRPLSKMPLTYLSLSHTPVSDLNPVKSAPLETLDLSWTQVEKLPNFQDMNFQARIILTGSKIKDLTPLKGKSIKHLNLTSTSIDSLQGLKDCNISTLFLNRTKIKDLSPLKGKSIKELRISTTPITDLSALSECKIEIIDFSHTKIKDASHLSQVNAKEINAYASSIEDIEFVNPQVIKFLQIGSTKVKSLEKLSKSNIEVLEAPHTHIEDISPLAECKYLNKLVLYNTPVKSIKPILDSRLKTLIIGECKNLKNISGIAKLRHLETLIFPSHIKDVRFINSLPRLKFTGYYDSEMGQSVRDFKRKLKAAKSNEQ